MVPFDAGSFMLFGYHWAVTKSLAPEHSSDVGDEKSHIFTSGNIGVLPDTSGNGYNRGITQYPSRIVDVRPYCL